MKKFNKIKGSALLVITVLSGAISLVTGTLLKSTVTEYNINERHIVRINAQNAAESAAETGVAQLVERWKSAASFSQDELDDNNSPLVVSNTLDSFLNNASTPVDSVDIKGKNITEGEWIYINPADPKNEFDSQKGKYVYARKVTVLSQSNVSRGTDIDVNAYSKMVLEVRDAPLFTHAVFYNMDLEYHPGAKMDMHGPVHTNGTVYAGTYDNLYFHSTVTTSQDYIHGLAPNHPNTPVDGHVWFKNNAGTFINDYKGSGSTSNYDNFYDSEMANWGEFASNRWNGNLQTQIHGVPNQNPIGYQPYVRDNPDTATIDDPLNYSYALIEPNLNVSNGISHPDHKGDGEKQKIANKAGLIIRLHETTTPPSSIAHKLSTNYYVTFHKLARTDSTNPNSAPILDGNGAVSEIDVEVDSSFVNDVFEMEEYSENFWGRPISGLWDARRGRAINTLNLNMGEFRKGVDDTAIGHNSDAFVDNYDTDDDYNGVIYVEFPIDTSVSGRDDKVILSKENLGLYVHNASNIPSPSILGNDPNRDIGLTLGTNNTMYIKGHFNADGLSLTGSATEPDIPGSPEPPAALFADSITMLSNNWNAYYSKSSQYYRPASFTEVNAALVQGIMPTGKGGQVVKSGGNHNFPRLLERWTGVTFRYRGSMIALFESEIGNQPVWTTYYSPPIRDWGYYEYLAMGKFPPGTPMVRSFKKLSFRQLTEAQYQSENNDA